MSIAVEPGRLHLLNVKKYWEGLFDYADENFHDTVGTQVLCDTIQIDSVSYFVKPGDYKPEWDKDGRQRLAQARIELCKKASNNTKQLTRDDRKAPKTKARQQHKVR